MGSAGTWDVEAVRWEVVSWKQNWPAHPLCRRKDMDGPVVWAVRALSLYPPGGGGSGL